MDRRPSYMSRFNTYSYVRYLSLLFLACEAVHDTLNDVLLESDGRVR
jgi:hypothetical protein